MDIMQICTEARANGMRERRPAMKNFVNMYRTFIRIAPFGVLITVLYFLLDAVCPALITVLFENIFQGL